MDDTACYQFFAEPVHPYHRQFDALRAVFFDHRSQKEVAEQFGYRHDSFRQLVAGFRQYCEVDPAFSQPPFFETLMSDVRMDGGKIALSL
jgi:hypothetical protein